MPQTHSRDSSGNDGEPVIVLVNQISQHGHLDMYARLYSACLLELGFRVVLIAQTENGIVEWLRTKIPSHYERFVFVARDSLTRHRAGPRIDIPDRSSLPLHRRGHLVWQSEGMWGVLMRLQEYAQRPFRALLSSSARGIRGISFTSLIDEIATAAELLDIRPSLVLFLYLDLMSEDRAGCRALGRKLKAPWAGILFHPRAGTDSKEGPERFFWARNARGAAFLNPDCIPTYARQFPRLAFATFPDVTDVDVLPEPSRLAKKLIVKAAGRTIVLQLGSISPHKGILELVEAIKLANPKEFFFAIIGEVFWDAFGADAQKLRAFFDSPPENCLAHAGYLNDERELNFIIRIADILYAVYRDFYGSSNTLTKASVFERPVLVSDDCLMGERVKRFRLGETVLYGDVEAIVSKLSELRDRPCGRFGFSEYRQEHSIDRLKLSLSELLQQWIGTTDELGAETGSAWKSQ
jgi:glycosyltransferase involved in cell wall biosynthesis